MDKKGKDSRGSSENRENRESVVEKFVRLVEIDSLSFGEREMADVLKQELEALGFEVTEDDAGAAYGSDTGNLYGFLKGIDPEREPVLLSAHMDTVVPGLGKRALIDPDTGVITSEGDTILGADDAAGIAEILEGIRLAKEAPGGYGDIEVLFTIAEEVYTKGAKGLDFGKIRSKTAFVMDMSGEVGTAANAAPSIISFSFGIKGRPAHAGFDPEAGINAVAIASMIIAGTRQGLLEDGLTFNIGTISGGRVSNIVPDSCVCTGEARCGRHEAAARAAAELESRIRSVCRAAGAECEFSSEVMIRAYETPEDDRACEVFRRACRNLGLPGGLVSTRGGSDNNVFAQHGIGGIVVGCGMNNTHSTSEYINISDLETGSRLVAELIALS